MNKLRIKTKSNFLLTDKGITDKADFGEYGFLLGFFGFCGGWLRKVFVSYIWLQQVLVAAYGIFYCGA